MAPARRQSPAPPAPFETAGASDFAVLNRGILAVLECPDIDSAARHILLTCRRLTGARRGRLALLDADGRGRWIAGIGASGPAARTSLPRPDARLGPFIARVGRGLVAGPAGAARRRTSLPHGCARWRTLLAVPLTTGGAVEGLLCLGDKPGGFSQRDLMVAASFGALAAAAHQRCSAAESLGRIAERFRSIFEQSPIGIALLDGEGRPVDANRTCLRIFGLRELARDAGGFRLFASPLLSPDQRARLGRRETLRAEIPLDFGRVRRERLFRTTRRGVIWIDTLLTPLLPRGGGPTTGYLAHVMDVTALHRSRRQLEAAKSGLERRVAAATRELRRANRALRAQVRAFERVKRSLEREQAFRNAVENSLRTGISVSDREGTILHVNRAFSRMVGWTARDLVGSRPPFPFWAPGDRRAYLAAFRELGASRPPPGGMRVRLLRRGGETFDAWMVVTPLRGPRGATAGWVAAVADISRQLRTEAELRASTAQLRRVSARLLEAEERERKRIARELHDSLGQTLTALKYRLEDAIDGCRGVARARPVRDRLTESVRILGGAIAEVRSVVADLRPAILDDLGLASALRWFCREFQATHRGIACEIATRVRDGTVPAHLKTVIFRLVQEGLTNAAKHSGARRARVRLALREKRVELAIEDDGRGFRPEAASRGAGLVGMRERTELAGGSFAIESRPGAGTVLRASWPLG